MPIPLFNSDCLELLKTALNSTGPLIDKINESQEEQRAQAKQQLACKIGDWKQDLHRPIARNRKQAQGQQLQPVDGLSLFGLNNNKE